MKINDSGSKLTLKNISEFEEQFNIKLPYDYREFMMENNGGTPEGNWGFKFVETNTSKETESIINYFEVIYPEQTTEIDDLKEGYIDLLESNQISNELIPIADDPFGNILLLGVKGDYYGKVVFGNHELEDPETGHIILSFVAESFSKFIDNCYEVNLED